MILMKWSYVVTHVLQLIVIMSYHSTANNVTSTGDVYDDCDNDVCRLLSVCLNGCQTVNDDAICSLAANHGHRSVCPSVCLFALYSWCCI